MVSDRAVRCPKCGCPVAASLKETVIEEIEEVTTDAAEEVQREEEADIYEYEEEKTQDRRKFWIIGSVVAVVLLVVAYLWAFTGKSGNSSADDIAEITPEFIEKISEYDILSGYSEGYAAVLKGEKYGYINTKGDEVIPCRYDMVEPFAEGYAVVKNGFKEGYIDVNGDSITSCKYDNAQDFSEERAAVCLDGKWGYINTKGEEVIPCMYPSINIYYEPGYFSEGVACLIVDEDGLAVFITPDGKEVPELSNKFYVQKNVVGNYSAPAFINGVCGDLRTTRETMNSETVAIDKSGNILQSERNDEWEKAFNHLSVADTLYRDESTAYIRSSAGDGELRLLGVKDVYGNEVVKPKYHILGTFSNGVALVGFIVDALPGMKSRAVLGYMDMKGNDTFSYVYKKMMEKAGTGGSDLALAGYDVDTRSVNYHAESEWNINYCFDQDGLLSSYGYTDECENSIYTLVNGALVVSDCTVSDGYDSEDSEHKICSYYYKKESDDHIIVYQKDLVTGEKTVYADVLFDDKGRIKSVNGEAIAYGYDNVPHDSDGKLIPPSLAVMGKTIPDFKTFRRTMYGYELVWGNDNGEYLEIKSWN